MTDNLLEYSWEKGFLNESIFNENLSSDCFERCWRYPKSLGHGCFRQIIFRPGFEICISDCRFISETYFSSFNWPSMIVFGFYMDGHYNIFTKQNNRNYFFSGEQQYILCLKKGLIEGKAKKGVSLKHIAVVISPIIFKNYFQIESIWPDISKYIFEENDSSRLLYSSNSIRSEAYIALNQIQNCQLTGLSRKLFMESRALELIAWNISNMSNDLQVRSSCILHPQDMEQTKFVRQILLDNLENPPDLKSLASSAGMSHPKLNRCFKKLYGMTVFEFLRNERLNMARKLLLEKGLTVTEASVQVGYDSLSHFCMAYKKQFGVSPGNFCQRPD